MPKKSGALVKRLLVSYIRSPWIGYLMSVEFTTSLKKTDLIQHLRKILVPHKSTISPKILDLIQYSFIGSRNLSGLLLNSTKIIQSRKCTISRKKPGHTQPLRKERPL